MTGDATNAQPGWYSDPDGGAEGLRYWDGSRWTETRAPSSGGRARKRRPSRALVIVLACAVIGGGLLWWTLVHNSAENTAIRACKEAVTRQLKSPTTAEFDEVYATDAATDGHDVTGYVDAENGFGAQVRTRFSCPAVTGAFTLDVDFDE